MKTEILEKEICDLENQLLKPETRQSPEIIAELLSEDSIEFCSSGYVYHFKKEDLYKMLVLIFMRLVLSSKLINIRKITLKYPANT